MAFGNVGKRILGVELPRAYGGYMLRSPTNNNATCTLGLWFCDTLGNPTFTDPLTLNPGNGWIWEGWIHDKSTNAYYSTGKFYDFYHADQDLAGPCKGPIGNGYDKPGQDWIQSGCVNPPITSIMNGNFEVFVTVEIENETGGALSSPFYLKPFHQGIIANSLGCSRFDNCFNQAVYGLMPSGRIRITN
jgi:hypothetical protein